MNAFFEARPVTEKPEKTGKYFIILNDNKGTETQDTFIQHSWETYRDKDIKCWLSPITPQGLTNEEIEQFATDYYNADYPLYKPVDIEVAIRTRTGKACIAAINFARAHYEQLLIAERGKSKWISVEQLPVDNDEDILVTGGGYLKPVIMRASYLHYILNYKGATTVYPTHWQPLPTQPL